MRGAASQVVMRVISERVLHATPVLSPIVLIAIHTSAQGAGSIYFWPFCLFPYPHFFGMICLFGEGCLHSLTDQRVSGLYTGAGKD